MDERILFLTGRLAHDSLCREIEGLENRMFSWRVQELGLQVAGLMTADMIRRRLPAPDDVQRIIVPGLCGGEVEALSQVYGMPVERGPKDLKDLPEFFGTAGRTSDLGEHGVTIIAEIVDAPHMAVGRILERAAAYRADGADVIDLGCLPGVDFPHMEDSVAALKDAGFAVSVDSLERPELARAAAAGADYLLSLRESTLDIAADSASVPVLIPEHPADLDSLYRAAETLAAEGRRFLLDPVLEPIHFGFTESLLRYHAVRRRYPEAEIMMGIGNLTELTDADTTGITALLMGVVSELGVGAVLTTEVSPHAHTSVREADIARRIMWAARRDGNLPRRYHAGLMALKDRKPFPHTSEEVAQTAAAIRDPSFRIQVTRAGLHVYNRDGHRLATDPFELWPELGVADDASHAFYLGVELGRAQIAWQLGKRYLQDNELEWGVAFRGAAQE
ncbi:MAG: DUF6513 domain-containing protein [Chromatiales bacterium]|nr:DUF6513 domain-containing protein [Chromatiales bacterium]